MIPEVITTSTFDKLCEKKKKNSDPYIVDKLTKAIAEIASSENPERLGEKKHGN